MKKFTDSELKIQGFRILVQALGDVNAERFIYLNNCEPGDYTRWRKDNLFPGERLDEILDRASHADHMHAERLVGSTAI